MARITKHPILKPSDGEPFPFTFDGERIEALPEETISSALFAAGIRVFGRHPKDGSPQGIFCANGQCSQCMVIAEGAPVKACVTVAAPNMIVESMKELPVLPENSEAPAMGETEIVDVDVLIIGGGPAGMSAALELASAKVDVLLIDDKDRLGGKLVLQTHRFFGSIDAVYAGTRGIDICARLATRVRELESVCVWTNSTALAVFSDRTVGVLKNDRYVLVRPRILLTATGAREKALVFQGNTLPGVYGAGAFQTLVNRDLVKASERTFIVGGGNVGLIAGYHALQAGIDVVGLVEALSECGGYKVHRDKLARMGVPIYPSHTVLSANGIDSVESVTIARIDDDFRPVTGTERTFQCDTVLIAVGLDPVDEFTRAARRFGLPGIAAGDADEIAEASAAIFSGRIAGRQIALELGATDEAVPEEWARTAEILKAHPGKTHDREATYLLSVTNEESRVSATPNRKEGSEGAVVANQMFHDSETLRNYSSTNDEFRESETPNEPSKAGFAFPVLHCTQEIPCNPCASVCPNGLIYIDESDIRQIPEYIADDIGKTCIGCMKCITICPGLAITLIDARKDVALPVVTIPFEFGEAGIRAGGTVVVMDVAGEVLGEVRVREIVRIPSNDRTVLVKVEAQRDIAERIAGIRVQAPRVGQSLPEVVRPLHDGDIVCRCERVTAGEIRDLIRKGYRDINEIKTLTRAGMGACGGKTCQAPILRLFRECGVPLDQITENVPRPLFVEVPFAAFASAQFGKTEESQVPSGLSGRGAKGGK
ncbi:FAD-dependent oxidoreductase [Candidatus Bipolaricaulota bacterium]|nr:FAD-dependent oxidoreductase [Candidatus Bipolaricaulota bacterium]